MSKISNEEKAREISIQYDPVGIAEDAALDMAEWKDKEISKLKKEISKLKEEIKNLKKENSDASWRYEAEHADDWRTPREMGQ